MKNNENLLRVALRHRAIYLDVDREQLKNQTYEPTAVLMAFVRRLAECGYTVSEELLHALQTVSIDNLLEITALIDQIFGLKLNWAPLLVGWDVPSGETIFDHIVTAFVNDFPNKSEFRGTTLPCGHLIPEGTFPIERYNGCPFCGTQFRTADFVYKGQGSKLKELQLFTPNEMQQIFVKLLTSPTPLDATQLDSLKLLTQSLPLPNVEIAMKESCMVVISALVERGDECLAQRYFTSPTDILRFLWYQKTGKAVIIRPKTLIATAQKWRGMFGVGPYKSTENLHEKMKAHLQLKYSRKECRRVATWLNELPLSPQKMAENMHPYRGMWVRLIRALRLAEFAKKAEFCKLAELLDLFYNEKYSVWQGKLNLVQNSGNQEVTLKMLSERPGFFARSLFATMLRFGSQPTLAAFRSVADRVPVRLVLSLTNAAELYFDEKAARYVSPITGGKVRIEPNKLLAFYSPEERCQMIADVNQLFLDVMNDRFAKMENKNKTIFIEPKLFDIPVGVGDRATTIQDASCALQGTRFAVEGDKIRLFMQWGVGLPAQHLDMDLSAKIIYDDRIDDCAYYHLATIGAKHSGDIRSIPHQVGTAEYVELNLDELRKNSARFVVFTCNAYSAGRLSPNLCVGWMSSENPMNISETNGVAYDPSCVQHVVRVADDNLSKGLVFGVLDVEKGEITWLELPNQNQTAFQTNSQAVTNFLQRLRAKCSVGQLLKIKAIAQNMQEVESAEFADEIYSYEWALNPAEVSALLK